MENNFWNAKFTIKMFSPNKVDFQETVGTALLQCVRTSLSHSHGSPVDPGHARRAQCWPLGQRETTRENAQPQLHQTESCQNLFFCRLAAVQVPRKTADPLGMRRLFSESQSEEGEQGELPGQTSTATDSDSFNTRKFHENYKKGMIGKRILFG